MSIPASMRGLGTAHGAATRCRWGAADRLEIALIALDSINARGKMIGIISHVEAMKERLPAHIKVEKGGGIGYSRLVV